MFIPSNIDEVSVQATHLESSKGKPSVEGVSKKQPRFEKKLKGKGKEKGKKETIVKKDTKDPTCSHCKKKGHEEAKCWKLHPNLLPEKFKGKGKQNIASRTTRSRFRLGG